MKCAVEAGSTHCQKHMRHILECVEELVATNNRLNRRCQEAESAARTKVDEVLRAGPSLGRALSAWAAGDYRRRLEECEKKQIQASAKEGILLHLQALKAYAKPCRRTDFPEGFTCPCAAHRVEAIGKLVLGE